MQEDKLTRAEFRRWKSDRITQLLESDIKSALQILKESLLSGACLKANDPSRAVAEHLASIGIFETILDYEPKELTDE
jgi:hypothetical protein